MAKIFLEVVGRLGLALIFVSAVFAQVVPFSVDGTLERQVLHLCP
jgi:hypothetical protein